ncbi:hypothetical protein B0H17DRAFT_1215055 [Mycena rosella]|uniref:Uncharacterized protein n=1 Tax=Mycena rosella TaxID=1033263 RepID=A0AAD7CLQ7_MYCRO|nr:hypothetical protein B0H17DRAFT_1215055 [Mycena rosella]
MYSQLDLWLPELRHFKPRANIRGNFAMFPFSSILSASPQLQTLDLIDLFWETGVEELLHALPPSIRRLEFSQLDDNILAILTPSPGIPALCCPALQDLILPQHTPTQPGVELSDEAILLLINAM